MYLAGRHKKSPLLAISARSGAPTTLCFSLEQCCGAALPGLPFFSRDLLHVAYVGAGLRQDMVQVVTDADERETLLEEFAYARGAE
jgi:hypothetical protein